MSGATFRQTGPGDADLQITTDAGRVVLDGDDVAQLLDYLHEDQVYGEWLEEKASIA